MRFELKRLQRELRITTVYVTHDQSEALALSHEIAVMNEGRILAGRHRRATIYERPANPFVADFVGTTNFIHGAVTAVQCRLADAACRTRDRRRHGAGDRAAARGDGCRALGAAGRRRAVRGGGAGCQRVARDRRPEGVPRRSDRLPREHRRTAAAVAHASAAATRIGHPIHVAIAPEKVLALAPAMPEFLDTPALFASVALPAGFHIAERMKAR